MTAEDKQIQDLRMEIDKLKAELAKSEELLSTALRDLMDNAQYPSVLASSVAKFIQHPERFEYKEVR